MASSNISQNWIFIGERQKILIYSIGIWVIPLMYGGICFQIRILVEHFSLFVASGVPASNSKPGSNWMKFINSTQQWPVSDAT